MLVLLRKVNEIESILAEAASDLPLTCTSRMTVDCRMVVAQKHINNLVVPQKISKGGLLFFPDEAMLEHSTLACASECLM